jgi:hypothetical protein
VLLDDQRRVRQHIAEQRQQSPSDATRAAAALAAARRHSLLDERGE